MTAAKTLRAVLCRLSVDRRFYLTGAPELVDHQGRAFRPTELAVVTVDGAMSTTTAHGVLRGARGSYGARYTLFRWYGLWEWQRATPVPEWIRQVVEADQP